MHCSTYGFLGLILAATPVVKAQGDDITREHTPPSSAACCATTLTPQQEAAARQARGEIAYFEDHAGVLPQAGVTATGLARLLSEHEQATGRRILGRIYGRFEPMHPGQTLGGFNRVSAEQLGVVNTGILVNYFAELDQWMIWLGEPLLPAFMGRRGTRDEFLENDGLMRQKDAYLEAAKQRAAQRVGVASGESPPSALVMEELLAAFVAMPFAPPSSP